MFNTQCIFYPSFLPGSVGEELWEFKDCNPGIWEMEETDDMEDVADLATPWLELLSKRRLAAAQASANVLMTLLMSILILTEENESV